MSRCAQVIMALCLIALGSCQTLSLTSLTPTSPASVVESWLPDLQAADVILIGETHDNPEHHRVQAKLIKALEPSAVIFEMVPSDKTDDVTIAVSQNRSLRDVLDWDNSGWPDWAIYEPVFAAAKLYGIIGAGVDKADVRRAMVEGAQLVSGLPEVYDLARALPDDQFADMRRALIDAHCGLIPDTVAENMIDAQRLRDASFAAAIVQALDNRDGGPVVLIAGSGHVRKDRAVPAYLRAVKPGAKVYAIGLFEEGASIDPELFDLIFATEATQREDPCEAFR